jgi:hypothetical protein
MLEAIMPLERINNLAGIPLFYDRFREGAYGVEAVPMRPFIDVEFQSLCEKCFADMQSVFTNAGYEITQIWSGGVGRSGSGRSYHHTNRAFDLDALVFEEKPMWVAKTFPQRPYLYLAIEARLRVEFGTVLNYDYNADHEDHFHFDNGTSVKFKRDAKSHVLFLQHTLEKLFNQDVGSAGVDGLMGGDTEAAMRRALDELGIGGLSNKENWIQYLRICAETAIDLENTIVVAEESVETQVAA